MKKITVILLVVSCLIVSGCASLSQVETETKPLGYTILDDALVMGFGVIMGACVYEEFYDN